MKHACPPCIINGKCRQTFDLRLHTLSALFHPFPIQHISQSQNNAVRCFRYTLRKNVEIKLTFHILLDSGLPTPSITRWCQKNLPPSTGKNISLFPNRSLTEKRVPKQYPWGAIATNSTPLSMGCQNSTPRGAKLRTALGVLFGHLFFLSVNFLFFLPFFLDHWRLEVRNQCNIMGQHGNLGCLVTSLEHCIDLPFNI